MSYSITITADMKLVQRDQIIYTADWPKHVLGTCVPCWDVGQPRAGSVCWATKCQWAKCPVRVGQPRANESRNGMYREATHQGQDTAT